MTLYDNKLGEAVALAAEVHKFQVDKSGAAYILHPLAVMERAKAYYLACSDGWGLEAIMIAAVLHDILEDIDEEHGWAKNRLAARIYETFGNEVSAAVDALTKQTMHAQGFPKEGAKETYDEYLGRVERNWIARVVKIADLSHNIDAFRLPSGEIKESDFERWDKYHRALVRLMKVELAFS